MSHRDDVFFIINDSNIRSMWTSDDDAKAVVFEAPIGFDRQITSNSFRMLAVRENTKRSIVVEERRLDALGDHAWGRAPMDRYPLLQRAVEALFKWTFVDRAIPEEDRANLGAGHFALGAAA